jgi:hypothetical protein
MRYADKKYLTQDRIKHQRQSAHSSPSTPRWSTVSCRIGSDAGPSFLLALFGSLEMLTGGLAAVMVSVLSNGSASPLLYTAVAAVFVALTAYWFLVIESSAST